MDRHGLARKIFTKKTTDYSFAILFFLIFSFFIMFAIEPNLATATSLRKQEEDLAKIDNLYEGQIINIAEIQNFMEQNRDDFYLLSDAIPQYPKVNKIVEDINAVAAKNSFTITKASIGEVNLIDTNKKGLNTLQMSVEGQATFEDCLNFIRDLFAQRRLKTIEQITVKKQNTPVSSASGQLDISLNLTGYYL